MPSFTWDKHRRRFDRAAVTLNQFRRAVLAMPGAVEASHMGHPDFRAGGKIFATLGWPDSAFAMIKLTPEQQGRFVAAAPRIFAPVPGGWGRRGSTQVRLATATKAALDQAIATACGNVAPKSLAGRKGRGSATGAPKQAHTSERGLRRAFARARAAVKAAKLPGVEESTSFGTPSLKLRGKLLLRVKDADTLVIRCPSEDKAMLMEAAPEIYFGTDHYKGWSAVLVRPSRIAAAELAHCLIRAWRMQAPAKLVARFAAAASKRKPRRGKRT